jgi:hypothetical protein
MSRDGLDPIDILRPSQRITEKHRGSNRKVVGFPGFRGFPKRKPNFFKFYFPLYKPLTFNYKFFLKKSLADHRAFDILYSLKDCSGGNNSPS